MVLLVAVGCGFGFSRAHASSLSGDTSHPNNSTFVLGERIAVTLQAVGLAPSATAPLAVKVDDQDGNEVFSTSIAMKADGSGNASATFEAPGTKYGFYRVSAALPDGTVLSSLGTRPAGFLTYAILADPAKRIDYGDAGSHFGMQGGFSAAQGSVIPYLGVRYFLAGPGWADLEQNRSGQSALERSAALAKGRSYPTQNPVISEIIYNGSPWRTYFVPLVVSAKLPPWALDPGTAGSICKTMSALNAAGVEALPKFAQQLAEGVAASYPKQSAHYYQVTWEPAKWCFGGTPQQLVQFYQLSYAAIHRNDPKAIVMGPTLFPENGSLLSDLWAAGFGNYVDAQSMHPYVKFPPETNGLLSNVRAQMKMAQDAKGHAISFVGTEQGLTSGAVGELNQALGDVRTTLLLLGEGFKIDFAFYIADFWQKDASETKNTYGYYWNLNPKIPYGTDKLAPKPVAPAYAAMTLLLDGTTAAVPMSNLSGTQVGYRFQRGGTSILALWDYMGPSMLSVATEKGNVQVCDWMANCSSAGSGGSINVKLSGSPTYVIEHER